MGASKCETGNVTDNAVTSAHKLKYCMLNNLFENCNLYSDERKGRVPKRDMKIATF